MGIERRSASSSRWSSSRPTRRLVELAEESARAALRFHMGDGRGDRDAHFAFENIKRSRAEFAFAADDFAAPVMTFHDGVPVQLEKCAGNILEDGQRQQFFDGGGRAFVLGAQRGADDEFIRERARGAGDHALSAGNARRFAHGVIVVEGDVRLRALSHPREHEIAANIVAAANAAVAQNAGVVRDGNGMARNRRSARGVRRGKRGARCPPASPASPVRNRPNAAVARRETDDRTSAARPACAERIRTRSEFVVTTMPDSAGRTQEAVKTRAPTSTTHTRQTPTGVSFCWWQSVGMCDAVHPRGVENESCPRERKLFVPSIVSSTRPSLRSCALLPARAAPRALADL